MIFNTQSIPTDLKKLRILLKRQYLILVICTIISFTIPAIIVITTLLRIFGNVINPNPVYNYKDIGISIVCIMFVLRSPYIKVIRVLKQLLNDIKDNIIKPKIVDAVDNLLFRASLIRCITAVNESLSSAILSVLLFVIFVCINR